MAYGFGGLGFTLYSFGMQGFPLVDEEKLRWSCILRAAKHPNNKHDAHNI